MKNIPLIIFSIILIGTASVYAQPQKITDWTDLSQQTRELFKAGKYDAAIQMAKKALKSAEKLEPSVRPSILFASLRDLAGCYFTQGQYDLAATTYVRALKVWDKARDTYHATIILYSMDECLRNLGAICQASGMHHEAEKFFEFAIPLLVKKYGPDDLLVTDSLEGLSLAYISQHKYDKAIPVCERSLAIQEKIFGPNNLLVADSLDKFATLLLVRKEYDRSEALFKRAIAIKEKMFGPNHPELSSTLENFALLYREAGRTRKAQELEERIERIQNTRN